MSFQDFFYVIIHFHTLLNQICAILNNAIYISEVFLTSSAIGDILAPAPCAHQRVFL